jgi:hypothetical protein
MNCETYTYRFCNKNERITTDVKKRA